MQNLFEKNLNSECCAFQRIQQHQNTFYHFHFLVCSLELTRVLKSEVRLRLGVFVVDDVLSDVLSQDLVEDVVDGQAEAGLVLQELLHQEGVEVVGVHHVIPGRGGHENAWVRSQFRNAYFRLCVDLDKKKPRSFKACSLVT